jgi:hypothetical protein
MAATLWNQPDIRRQEKLSRHCQGLGDWRRPQSASAQSERFVTRRRADFGRLRHVRNRFSNFAMPAHDPAKLLLAKAGSCGLPLRDGRNRGSSTMTATKSPLGETRRIVAARAFGRRWAIGISRNCPQRHSSKAAGSVTGDAALDR